MGPEGGLAPSGTWEKSNWSILGGEKRSETDYGDECVLCDL